MNLDRQFAKSQHQKFIKRCLELVPYRMKSLETLKLLNVYFSLAELDLMNMLDKLPFSKSEFIEWIYQMMLPVSEDAQTGFRPSSWFCSNEDDLSQYDQSHLTMTHCALLSLILLGDDLSRIDRRQLSNGLKLFQLNDGSFRPTVAEAEHDVRFIYSACVIAYCIDDWSGIDVDKCVQFLLRSFSYEGGFGQTPFNEAHGGATYCAVASLYLMGRLHCLSVKQRERLIYWCIRKQVQGFRGRPDKDEDSCYSFWVCATLAILDCKHFIDQNANLNFLLDCQDEVLGGFSKAPGTYSDPLHTHFSISALSINENFGLKPLHPAFDISLNVKHRLDDLHKKWNEVN